MFHRKLSSSPMKNSFLIKDLLMSDNHDIRVEFDSEPTDLKNIGDDNDDDDDEHKKDVNVEEERFTIDCEAASSLSNKVQDNIMQLPHRILPTSFEFFPQARSGQDLFMDNLRLLNSSTLSSSNQQRNLLLATAAMDTLNNYQDHKRSSSDLGDVVEKQQNQSLPQINHSQLELFLKNQYYGIRYHQNDLILSKFTIG